MRMVWMPSNVQPTSAVSPVPSTPTVLTEVTAVTGRWGRSTRLPRARRMRVVSVAVKVHRASARNRAEACARTAAAWSASSPVDASSARRSATSSTEASAAISRCLLSLVREPARRVVGRGATGMSQPRQPNRPAAQALIRYPASGRRTVHAATRCPRQG